MEKSLFKKIIICLFLLILIPVIDGIYIIRYLHIKSNDAEVVLDRHFKGVSLSNHLNYLTNEADAAWKEYLLTNDLNKKSEYLTLINLFNQTLNDLSTPSNTPLEKKSLIESIRRISDQKIEFYARTFNKSSSSQEELSRLLRTRFAELDNDLTKEINELASFETAHFIEARENLIDSRDQVIKHVALSSLIPILMVVILILLIRSLLKKGEIAHNETLRAVKSRDDVLAVVSHDLKNPLSIIILSYELLKKKIDKENIIDERLNKSVESIGRAAQVMKDLIQNLLDQVKLEAGVLKLDLQKENLSEVIKNSELLLAPIATERSIEIINKLPHDPLNIYCDKKRLMQVLSNLLGNAIKFLSPGDKISVTAERNKKELIISVADTGPGIPAEELPHLFDRYWQAQKTSKLGTGLGLSIVKGLVEAHGGKVWVTSQLKVGSTFSFSLPLK